VDLVRRRIETLSMAVGIFLITLVAESYFFHFKLIERVVGVLAEAALDLDLEASFALFICQVVEKFGFDSV
jgi:hypothetical protein